MSTAVQTGKKIVIPIRSKLNSSRPSLIPPITNTVAMVMETPAIHADRRNPNRQNWWQSTAGRTETYAKMTTATVNIGQKAGTEIPCPADRAMSSTETQEAVAGAWLNDPAGG